MAAQLTPEEWCNLLFGEADGWISVFSIDKDGERNVRWATDARSFATIVDNLGDANVWLGCATRHENLGGQRGGDDDCYEVPGLWLDIDIAGPHHKALNLPQTRDDAVALLKDFPLRPSVVLDTGGGLQAWWLFDELQGAPDVEPLLKRWCATWQELGRRRGWHVDNVFDVARVLRVPGTYNHKSDPAKPVTVVRSLSDQRFTLEDLDEYTIDAPAEPERPPTPTYDGPERAGDRYNKTTDAGRLLEAHGCVFDHADRDGTKHYRAPHHRDEKGTTGIVVHTDGYTVVFSETFASQTGLEVSKPYDPFGLFTRLDHGGDWGAAVRAIEPRTEVTNLQHDLVAPTAGVVALQTMSDAELDDLQAALTAPFVPGGSFIFDETVDIEIRWGTGHEVLWATGESLMLCGPPGVGKTTIAHQLVAGLTGIRPQVLGYDVTPATRVLYLAMDRPRQIRRAFRRLFRPEERKLLDERMIVHRGPMISDLAKRPELLLELAIAAEADVVIIDSLKDAAVKLSDDETGGNVNRAIQMCNAENVDICVLHHQRKGQDGAKPTKLEDVYGSTWLTAGTGSVVLLWGEAGASNVELLHLKQPIDPVGPLTIEHDHIAGVSKVILQFNLMQFLRQRGASGATLTDVARAEFSTATPSEANKKTSERRLKRLVNDGKIDHIPQPYPGAEAQYVIKTGVHVADLVA